MREFLLPRCAALGRALVVVLVWNIAAAALALEGYMATVTANPGKIMAGAKVLAEVPQGTRLWVFSKSNDEKWLDVKVPRGEQHGWILATELKAAPYKDDANAGVITVVEKMASDALAQDPAKQEAKTNPRKHYVGELLMQELVFDPSDPRLAVTLFELGKAKAAEGDHGPAGSDFRKALTICKTMLGQEHPLTKELTRALEHANRNEPIPGQQEQFEKQVARLKAEEAVNGPSESSRQFRELVLGEKPEPAKQEVVLQQPAAKQVPAKQPEPPKAGAQASAPAEQGGFLVVVKTEPGKIMAGSKVLAEVSKGTRLWVFSTNANWGEVKVPNQAERGWISVTSLQPAADPQKVQAMVPQFEKALTEFSQHIAARRLPEAHQALEKAYELQRGVFGSDEHPEIARLLRISGDLARSRKDYRLSTTRLEQAVKTLRNMLGNHLWTVEALEGLAATEHEQQHFDKAEPLLVEALAMLRGLADVPPDRVALMHLALANVQRDQGKYPAARENLESTLQLRLKHQGEAHLDTCLTRNNLGLLLREMGDYEAARQELTKAIQQLEKVPSAGTMLATALNNLGLVEFDSGQIDQAEPFYQRSLKLHQQHSATDKSQQLQVINNLGTVAMNRQDFAAAEKLFLQAQEIILQAYGEQHPLYGGVLNNLGELARQRGDYPQAQKYLDQALRVRAQVLGQDHPESIVTLLNLANLAAGVGDYPEAIRRAEMALKISDKKLGPEHEKRIALLNNLAIHQKAAGNFELGGKLLLEALKLAKKKLARDHHLVHTLMNNYAEFGIIAKDYEGVESMLNQILKEQRAKYQRDDEKIVHTLINLAGCYREHGQLETARRHYEEALAMSRRLFGNQGRQVRELLKALAFTANRERNIPALIEYLDQSRRVERAHVQRVLPYLSPAEQLRFHEQLYSAAWHSALSMGWQQRERENVTTIAAGWLINGKSVSQESLAVRELALRDTQDPKLGPLVKELHELRRKLASQALAAPKPDGSQQSAVPSAKLVEQEQQLARQLTQQSGTLASDQAWIDATALRRAIPAQSIYIDFVWMSVYDDDAQQWGKPRYFAWIIPPADQGAIQVLDLGEAARIDQALQQVRQELAAASSANGTLVTQGEAAAVAQANKDLQAVADLVLKPLLPHLADKQQLILSPDGALWLLPWAALPVAENKCLLEQCAIRFVTSGRDLVKKPSDAQFAPTAPAIVVNPDYDLAGAAAKAAIRAVLPEFRIDENATRGETSRSSLPRVAALPFTALEGAAAKSSLEQLAKTAPVLHEQEQALEAVVKRFQRPKHLLLSTHGFFLPDQEVKNADKPDLLASTDNNSTPAVALTTEGVPVENPLLRCGLLFAGCNSPRTPGLDDGILTGLEIVGMDLRGTELVVLSACETGIGRVRNGEGVAGLRQAFQLAGAQSVVSTLWQVPDRDSALIMQDFFTNLAAGQSKAEALRHAQLKRIAARQEKSGAAHPFFWAAWTVTGE